MRLLYRAATSVVNRELSAKVRKARIGGTDMLEQPMIEKLLGMRLQGMADALKTQEQTPVSGS